MYYILEMVTATVTPLNLEKDASLWFCLQESSCFRMYMGHVLQLPL